MEENKDQCWALITEAFPINGHFEKLHANFEEHKLIKLIEYLKHFGLGKLIVELTLSTLWDVLRKQTVPNFWKHFKLTTQKSLDTGDSILELFSVLEQSIGSLHSECSKFIAIIKRCQQVCEDCLIPLTSLSFEALNTTLKSDESLQSLLRLHLRATLHCMMPSSYSEVFHKAYSSAFRVFCYNNRLFTKDEMGNDRDEDFCPGCGVKSCVCEEILESFDNLNQKLRELELLERLTGSIIFDLLHNTISDYIIYVNRNSYDQYLIGTLENWQERIVSSWLQYVYCGKNVVGVSPSIASMIHFNVKETFKKHLYQQYSYVRIGQLFNIIIEYPDSRPALEDIKDCLDKTNLRNELTKSLTLAFKTRLLHPGVNTVDILHAYISSIKALRILDTRGILLELVSSPIRTYLRSRKDFVRYIVNSLSDQSASELSEELSVCGPLVMDDSYSDDDVTDWQTWVPDPAYASTRSKSKSQRTADIVSMLVNIYGSKDVFITEYRTILADRILSQFNYDTEREIRYLEHLKLRFGENLTSLHKCEVMVKDVADSRRINASVHCEGKPLIKDGIFPVYSVVLSSQFWPSFKTETLKLPTEILNELDKFTDAYQRFKGNRTLNWKYHLGQVNIEIELESKTLNMNVTPIQAAIIYYFEKQNQWTLADLSNVLQIPKANLRRKITFWLAQGIIEEATKDIFTLVEDERFVENISTNRNTSDLNITGADCVEEENESVMASAHDQRQEELQVLWQFIVGMLTNLDSLPLERIHSMLKMFSQDSPECSQDELRIFLQTKVTEQHLTFSNGVYRLHKP